MNYYIHRISHEGEIARKLLLKGFLTIGFSSLVLDKAFDFYSFQANKTMEMFEEIYTEKYLKLDRSRHSFVRFVCDIKPKDIVLVPSPCHFSVYEVTESAAPIEKLPYALKSVLMRSEGASADLGSFIKVSPIMEDISRELFADKKLTARLKIRTTNANVSDLKKSILDAIESAKNKKPISVYSVFMQPLSEKLMLCIQNEVTPDKLEHLIKWYFEKIGASEVYIPPKRSKNSEGYADADIIANFNNLRLTIYVQAKSHREYSDDWAIKQITEYQSQNEISDQGFAGIAWALTTCKFSESALEAASNSKVILIDGIAFSKMLLDAGLVNLDDAFKK